MSVKVGNTAHIYLTLPKYLSIQDGFTFGEKLAQIEKTSKKKFIDLSDDEILSTIKLLIQDKSYYEDEFPDEAFTINFLKK